MGDILSHRPVLLIAAVFSRHASALDWARKTSAAVWGPIALESDRFAHDETRYYEASMGPDLQKTFFVFEQLVDPARLVDFKLQSNAWEEEFKTASDHSEPRPLNIDPGYLTEAKLVLASTKDRDHRLYLDRGIYAENTLYYTRGAWQSRPWTYPDYLRADYHEFFVKCRDYLRARYRSGT
jgi:hypothetical protein